jgi:hypothetical protein
MNYGSVKASKVYADYSKPRRTVASSTSTDSVTAYFLYFFVHTTKHIPWKKGLEIQA